ncbi:MAG: ABC transporter permease [Chloroflexota bacterium]
MADPVAEPVAPTMPARGSGPGRLRRLVGRAVVPVLAVLLGLAVGAIAIVLTGGSVAQGYQELIRGALGTPNAITATLLRATPVVITGVGLAIAFRAGCFNLGGEGQMIVSGVMTAVAASTFGGLPAPLLILVSVALGCAAGALWALIGAWLEVRFEVPLLITSLLLNYVAIAFSAYLVSYPLRDLSGGAALAQTVMIPDAAQLPNLLGITRLHIGVLLMLVLPLVTAWWMSRTSTGYELRMTGHNPLFAEYGGVSRRRVVLRTMALSGALCGLSGAIVVLGVHHRYIDSSITGPGYAWNGFTAALLAGGDPLTTLVSGVFLAALDVGAAGMERKADIPIQVVDIVQASIILMIAIRLTLGRWLGRRFRWAAA